MTLLLQWIVSRALALNNCLCKVQFKRLLHFRCQNELAGYGKCRTRQTLAELIKVCQLRCINQLTVSEVSAVIQLNEGNLPVAPV
ncbi:hypothetical protein RCJ22_30460, partial [Vibrio sp. FNV 38]|nr:hypothetical protein [Vibrio sp. FNV 38]